MYRPPVRYFAFSFVLLLTGLPAAFGQQSLFNVPSSEITREGTIFFQEQLAYAAQVLQSNSTLCYGLPWNMEVGFDVLNLDLDLSGSGPRFDLNHSDFTRALAPLVVASFQKGIDFTDNFRLGVGVQAGTNLFGSAGDFHPLFFAYLNSVTKLFDDRLRLYFGVFYGNSFYLGLRDRFQWMAGIEIPLWRDQFHIVVDHLHGHHNLGLTVLGATYFPWKGFALSLGAQLANDDAPTSDGIVLELTWL